MKNNIRFEVTFTNIQATEDDLFYCRYSAKNIFSSDIDNPFKQMVRVDKRFDNSAKDKYKVILKVIYEPSKKK